MICRRLPATSENSPTPASPHTASMAHPFFKMLLSSLYGNNSVVCSADNESE
jgi:hypothetical protein